MSHPFLGSLQGNTGNKFLDSFSEGENPMLSTAMGRQTVEQTSIYENIAKLKKLKETAGADQQERLDALIKSLESQTEGFTRPEEERGGHGYAKLGNLGRGAAAGIARGPVVVGELLATIPKLVGSDVGSNLRHSLAERAQLIIETTDPEGAAGAIGEFAGQMPAQMLAFEGMAKAVPGLKPWINKEVSGGVVKRAGVAAAKSAAVATPFSLLQAAGLEEASVSDRIKQFALGELGAAATGFLPIAPKATAKRAGVSAGAEVPVVPKEELARREAELTAINAKAAAEKAERDGKKQLERLAKAQWTLENPDAVWKDLAKTDRTAYINAFKTKQVPVERAPAETTVPVYEQSVQLAKKELEVAEATGTPEVVEAAKLKIDTANRIANAHERLEQIATSFSDPARHPEELHDLASQFRYFVQDLKAMGQQTAGLEDALTTMETKARTSYDAMPEAASVAETRPTLDKPTIIKSTAGLSPAVQEVIERRTLANAIEVLGGTAATNTPKDALERQLAALKAKMAEPVVAPTPVAPKTYTVAEYVHGKELGIDVVPSGLTFKPEELPARWTEFPRWYTTSYAKELIKRLAILRRTVAEGQKIAGADDPLFSGYKLTQIDELLKQGKSYQSGSITPKEFESLLQADSYNVAKDVELTEAGEQAYETIRRWASEPANHNLVNVKSVYVRTAAEYKGVTPEAIMAELAPLMKKHTLADAAAEANKVGLPVIPAIRTKDGRVFTGVLHSEAAQAAKAAGAFGDKFPGDAGYDSGFVTKDGQFLDRNQATKWVSDNGFGEPISELDALDLDNNSRARIVPTEVQTTPSAGTTPSGGTGLSPSTSPAPHAVAVAGQKPTGTFLTAIEHKKPLEALTPKQLSKVEDLVVDGIEQAAGTDQALYQQLMRDNELIRAEIARREVATPIVRPHQNDTPEDLQTQRDVLEAKVEELEKNVKGLADAEKVAAKATLKDAEERLSLVRQEIALRKIEARSAAPKGKPAPKPVEVVPEERPLTADDFRKAPSKLGNTDLDRQIDAIHDRLSVIDPRDAEPWSKRLSKLMEEKAARSTKKEGPDGMPPVSSDGLKLQTHPAVGAFAGGYVYGLMTGDADDPDYQSRAFMWGLGSAGLVVGAKYLGDRKKALDKPKVSVLPGMEDMPKVVYSVDDLAGAKVSTLTRLRQFYQGMVRGTDGLERVPINRDLPTQRNPGKLAAMYGSYAARTEQWLTNKVTYVDPATGEPMPVILNGKEVLPLQAVLDMAQGDKEALGNLAVAYASAEAAGRRPVPMDQVHREVLIRNAPEFLVNAAKEFRRYSAAGIWLMNKIGRLSDEGFRISMSEDWYTPLHRVIETMEELRKKKSNTIGAPNSLYGRKGGSTKSVKNPYDVAVDMTARMLRAAEYGNIIEQFVLRAEELPATVRHSLIQPISKQMNPKALEVEVAVKELRKLTSLSEADAKGMLAYMDSDAINETPGIITHWRNGELHSYRVNSEIFQAIKSMAPPEIDMFWKVLGAPARFASKGVVYHPGFTESQFIVDSWTSFMTSKYGFRPGIDSIRGWWHDFTGSPQYQKLMDVGGPTSLQSLKYIQKGETSVTAVEMAGTSAARTAWNNMKELKLWEAYKAVLLPVANAARVGEYLRALDHGASTLEAAYAAQNVLGNYRMQGHFQGMRIFNYLTMFSRPALAAMDATLEASGMHPYRPPEFAKTAYGKAMESAGVNSRVAASLSFMTKGFVGIALPTAMLWYVNKDDEEINQVRRTALGTRYWFFRGADDTIVRVRRPQVLGEVFGASMEATLDKMYSDDPRGTERMLSGLWDEAMLNVVPQVGVIPLSLWANKKTGLGSPIVPGRDARVDPAMQGRTDATLPSRIIADKVSDFSAQSNLEPLRAALSPAGLDYIFGTFAGMLGQDALRGLNAAMTYKQKGFLPSKEELPIMARLFARYPSMNVKEAQEFYDRDSKVQAAAGTITQYIQEDPTKLADYYTNNLDRVQLIKLHEEVRQKVADMRRAIDDLKNAPQGLIEKDLLDSTTKSFTALILQHMKIANDFATQLEKNK